MKTNISRWILSVVVLLVLAVAVHAQTPAAASPFPPAFLSAGWNWTNPGHNAVALAYAHKTALFNGSTNFPTYSYSQVRGYSCLFAKTKTGASTSQNCTDYSTGLLFPFYDRAFFTGKVRVTLAVAGEVGATQAPSNIGYTIGADTLAHVTLPKFSNHWGFAASSNVSRSSVGGLTATTASARLTYSFGGF